MLENMKNCMWKREVLDPGIMGYDDYEDSLVQRRTRTEADLRQGFQNAFAPFHSAILAYYDGDEKPLRDFGFIWTTSFNVGANCATKHLVLRLWEKNENLLEYQW